MAGDMVVANAVLLNAQRQTMRNNQPLFSVGNNAIAGYVSTVMYNQVSSSKVESNAEAATQVGQTSGTYDVTQAPAAPGNTNDVDLYKGETLASGQPYIIAEATTAVDIVGTVV